jgi:hypothetical protein
VKTKANAQWKTEMKRFIEKSVRRKVNSDWKGWNTRLSRVIPDQLAATKKPIQSP